MEATKQLLSSLKLISAFALVAITMHFSVNKHEITKNIQLALRNANQASVDGNLPANLLMALSAAFGHYESLINQEDLLGDLQAADIVIIGESHADQRDMQTAFEITRVLAQRRKVALAVERFPLTLQPRLRAMNKIDNGVLREMAMRRIFQTKDYQTVWRPDSIFSPYLSYPSADEFEAMALWVARERIPIIGLDLPLSERALGLGEDIPYRNELWKNQIVNFLEKNQSENYLIIAIGGIDHFNNTPGSVQAKLRKKLPKSRLLSIGQRDANYSAKISLQVEDLAQLYEVDDLILQSPEYAVVRQNGTVIFPTPPDYWIAVHLVDSWEK